MSLADYIAGCFADRLWILRYVRLDTVHAANSVDRQGRLSSSNPFGLDNQELDPDFAPVQLQKLKP